MVVDTGNYVRFERVSAVETTDRGLLARVHGEKLRVDVVRPDIVRFKISRGGVFDESPTFAVCVDPLAEFVEFAVEQDAGVVRLRTSDLVVDVHRHDGTTVIETAADDEGRFRPYATLNDAFTTRRRCRQEDAIYGLGEKTGHHNRRGRDFTLWNTDVLDPHATREFTAGWPASDPRSDPVSTDFDLYYVSMPFFYHHSYPTGTMAASFVDNGYRGHYDFSQQSEYEIQFAGGQYTE
jgi:alpha-glucosidase